MNQTRDSQTPTTLTRFTGVLGAAEIAAGMNAAIRNAGRLAEDAESLLALGRFPSAAALAVLSIEESGKVTILRRLSIEPDEPSRRKTWKEFRRHTSKNPHWVFPDLVRNGARQLEDLREVVGGDHADVLESIKQLATYADCLGDAGRWSEPASAIEEGLARDLIERARLLLPVREIATREVELWVEHVGPHYPRSEMGQAVIRWFAAMRDEGLTDLEPDAMAKFMGRLAGSQ
jgi:AbiV family abortive infection protein